MLGHVLLCSLSMAIRGVGGTSLGNNRLIFVAV